MKELSIFSSWFTVALTVVVLALAVWGLTRSLHHNKPEFYVNECNEGFAVSSDWVLRNSINPSLYYTRYNLNASTSPNDPNTPPNFGGSYKCNPYPASYWKANIAPRQPIVDYGYGDDLSFFPINKGWYDIVGQGVKNDFCRFVGDMYPNNLACILSTDISSATSKFGDTNLYATTFKGRNVLDIARTQTPE